MRIDHVSYACGPDGLDATVARLSKALGATFVDGGRHPRFGTVNAILPLADEVYLEVVAVLEHPAADKAPFGRAVKQRVAAGGGWLGWVVAVDDVDAVAARLGAAAEPGQRHRPDGQELRWRQAGIAGFLGSPYLPLFITWDTASTDHPATGGSAGLRLEKLEMAGRRDEALRWLDEPQVDPLEGIALEWVDGPPGLVAAHIATPAGVVRVV